VVECLTSKCKTLNLKKKVEEVLKEFRSSLIPLLPIAWELGLRRGEKETNNKQQGETQEMSLSMRKSFQCLHVQLNAAISLRDKTNQSRNWVAKHFPHKTSQSVLIFSFTC
jgi:hypothetical protein